jgi:hypothetical protein
MSWLAPLCLYILHALYSVIFGISSYWQHLFHRDPLPLISLRSRIPTHLAILLTASPECGPEDTENAYIESIKRASAWCQEVGVNVLTVYDNDGKHRLSPLDFWPGITAVWYPDQGVLLSCSKNIRECVTVQEGELVGHDESSCSDIEYPLTPPLSDCSGSRSISPEDGQEIGVISIRTTLDHDARSSRKRREVMTRRRPSSERPALWSFCLLTEDQRRKGHWHSFHAILYSYSIPRSWETCGCIARSRSRPTRDSAESRRGKIQAFCRGARLSFGRCRID